MAQAPGDDRKRSFKRIVLCCDGSWLDALGKNSANPPSNVVRIARSIKTTASDGTNQIIFYHAGVGSGGTFIDNIEGTFAIGLDQNIREVYNFICSNYADGDDIILIGFSRGAFTARSVGDMIASIGLLNSDGLDRFYEIFVDYENMGDDKRSPKDFLCPGLAPYAGQHGTDRIRWEDERLAKYTQWLKDNKLTRTTYNNGANEITIKALGVWETVGVLGIPPIPVIGIAGSADQWKFTNTRISNKVENAFHGLALDEPRYAFRPAMWERVGNNKTNLRQVWFPGSHSTVGGGAQDQAIANITLAWMCDQLSTVGLEFSYTALRKIFLSGLRYSAAHPFPYVPSSLLHRVSSQPLPWAKPPIFAAADAGLLRDTADCTGKDVHPDGTPAELLKRARPWSLGQIRQPTSGLQMAAGTTVRHPGMALRVDPTTNEDTTEPLLRTDERIHSCVRVRLAAGGLGLDDEKVWECKSLATDDHGKPLWRLEHQSGWDDAAQAAARTFRPREVSLGEAAGYPAAGLYDVLPTQNQWRWNFAQGLGHGTGENRVPQALMLPEEPMVGYWERLNLALATGNPDVWSWAEGNPPVAFKAVGT